MSELEFVERLRAIETDPDNRWLQTKEDPEGDLYPARIHPLMDEVLVAALRAAGWTGVADEYIRIRDKGGFWYD